MDSRRSLLSFALLLVLLSTRSAAQVLSPDPDLWAYAFAPRLVDPEFPFDLDVRIVNTAWGPATDVVIDIAIPSAAGFIDLPAGCDATTTQTVRCSVDVVPARTSSAPAERRFPIRVRAPEQRPGNALLAGTVTVSSKETDANPSNNADAFTTTMFHTVYVRTAEAWGSDSLWMAIARLNSECTPSLPCKLAFRIDPAGAPWVTLRPGAPLPPITGAHVWVDGDMQARFYGETNPVGPEIEINGSLLEPGSDGLVIESGCRAEVAGLAINGFPGAGIVAAGNDECLLEKAYLWDYTHRIRFVYVGTDPTGMRAIPNYRGIVVRYASPRYERVGLWSMWQIEESIISGNVRAGIFSESGTWRIARNRIGVNRDLTGDLGNGASGVYLGPRSHGTDVENSYIMFNHDFGIATDREVTWSAVTGGSIGGNWQGAIDIGLDGPTLSLGGSQWEPPLQLPVITRAAWDPAEGTTVVEGILPDPPQTLGRYTISVYANDVPDASGYGEGQYFLGTATAGADGRFLFRHHGDLTGKWIAVTATRSHYTGFAKPPSAPAAMGTNTQGMVSVTTEFSRAVEVK